MRRSLAACSLLFVFLSGPALPPASACPNCKQANQEVNSKVAVTPQTANNKPRAYMYSIIFMIGMVVTVFTAFGVSFYLMIRKAQAKLRLENGLQEGANANTDHHIPPQGPLTDPALP